MTPLRFLFGLLLASLILLAAPAVRAGIAAEDSCGEDCAAALAAFAPVYFGEHAPVLAAPSHLFPDGGSPANCPAREEKGPVVFGVLLGPTYSRSGLALEGPANDVQLMTQAMRDRGVTAPRIAAVAGAEATRSGMLGAMARFLPCLRERDQIVLFFTGWASVYPDEWFSPNDYAAAFCGWSGHSAVAGICGTLAKDDVSSAYLDSVRQVLSDTVVRWLTSVQATRHFLPGNRQHVLMADDSAWQESDGGQALSHLDGVTAAEISNFVTRVRNRGADAFLIIDTRLAGSGDLVALQQQAGAAPAWAADGDVIVAQDGFPAIQNNLEAQGIVPLFGTGQFAVLYGSDQYSSAFEYRQGADRKQLGALTFRVSELLRTGGAVKFADMSRVIAKSFDAYNKTVAEGQRQEPMFMASNLDITLLAPRAAPPQPQNQIEVIQPKPLRGASEAVPPSVTVVARYTGGGKAEMAIVGGELVPVDQNGQFRRDIEDTSGLFTIPFLRN